MCIRTSRLINVYYKQDLNVLNKEMVSVYTSFSYSSLTTNLKYTVYTVVDALSFRNRIRVLFFTFKTHLLQHKLYVGLHTYGILLRFILDLPTIMAAAKEGVIIRTVICSHYQNYYQWWLSQLDPQYPIHWHISLLNTSDLY